MGCYVLELEEPETEAKLRGIPDGVELREEALVGWPRRGAEGPRYQARTLTDGERRETPFNYWTRLQGDSLLVSHPGAMQGFTLRLEVGEEELRGNLTAFTDVAADPVEAQRERSVPIVARSAECPPES